MEKKSILIVDDAAVIRRNLRNMLEEAGYVVVAEATNGEDAYVEYKKRKPDLVTMDITMPDMNGIGAVEKIVSEFPDAKIVMISAMGQRLMVLEAIEKGAKHFIVKPFDQEKVLSVIKMVMERAS